MTGRKRFIIIFTAVVLGAALYYLLTVDRSNAMALIGIVDANQVIVSSKIEGRIEKLLVEEGTQVRQGDLIAVLDRDELEAEKRAAEATLASLQAQVSASSYTEQMTRGANDSDVTNAKARLRAARSSLAEAQANLQQTELDSARTIQLADQGVASQQDRDRAEAVLKAQRAHVQALLDQAHAAEADLNSAVARLHQINAAASTVEAMHAQMLTAQAQKAEAETRLSYTNIYAPVSGFVSVRAAREGEVVNPGTPIVTIVDLTDTWAYAAIPETYADRIRLNDRLKVRMPGGNTVEGTVFYKAAEGDYATQRDVGRRKRDIKTVALKVRLDNRQRNLVPGMTAEVLVPNSVIEGKNFAPSAEGNTTQPYTAPPPASMPATAAAQRAQ
jgi:multidrug resistance efflux pump